MPLPRELWDVEDETAVVGDVDALIAYIESGNALSDWADRIMQVQREMEIWADRPQVDLRALF